MIIPPFSYHEDISLASISIEKIQEMLDTAEDSKLKNLEKSEILQMHFDRAKK